MKTTFEARTSAAESRSHLRFRAGAGVTRFAALLFAMTLGVGLTGCSFLKPARETARHFVLTPMAATGPGPVASNALAVGLGQVKLPS